MICGLGILILGTAANIYAEEEYSESHTASDLPPNLQAIEAKFELFQPQQLVPGSIDDLKKIADKSFSYPLSLNRSAFRPDPNPVTG